MKSHKPAIDLQPITDALDALKACVAATLPPAPAITYKAREWNYDSAIDEDGDKHESVASYAAAYAFEPDNLGGGVMAYHHDRDDESYVSITGKDDMLPDNFLSWVNVGVYRKDDSGSSFVCRGDLAFCEAMHWAMHVAAPAQDSQRYVDARGMPKVGECYWIHAEIERYPHFRCPANQYATVTYVDAETFNIRPATPVEWDESDEVTWGTVQFTTHSGGLEEFHDACALASTRAKYIAEEPLPLSTDAKERLVDDALDAGARVIQDRMGVTTGDAAAQFFSGEEGDKIMETFRRYIAFEQDMLKLEAEGGK